MLKFHNTLTGSLEEFQPIDPPTVRLYSCGPTVYDFAHIGNFRTFVFIDVLRRHLKYRGFTLHHVMNLTDIDDKTIHRAQAEGVPLRELTDRYIQAFLDDMKTLNLEPPEIVPRATDYIPQMVELVQRLEARGHTYGSDGSVYFSIATFPGYGKLSKINLEGNLAGARVDADSYEKADARDFVLWKAPKDEHEPRWESAIGAGRPGWHLECSVMSMAHLGETFDIHCGGVDLIFPHHENEIAQSEGATGQPFARTWLHAEHLMVEGEKMSKSKGNYYTLRDLLDRGHDPMGVRYALLSTPYRTQLNFTFDGLRAAERTVQGLRDFRRAVRQAQCQPGAGESLTEATARAQADFEAGLDDDLNTAQALAAIHTLAREVNVTLASGGLRADDRQAVLQLLDRADTVFAVLGPEAEDLPDAQIQALIDERNQARASAQYARADEIRQQLTQMGIILEDTKQGTRWKRE